MGFYYLTLLLHRVYIWMEMGWKILGQRSVDVKSTGTFDTKLNKLGATA